MHNKYLETFLTVVDCRSLTQSVQTAIHFAHRHHETDQPV